MKRGKGKILLKYGLYSLIWVTILGIIAIIIKKSSTLNFKDIVFVEGILLIIVGFFSSMGGETTGSVNLLGQGIGSFYSNYANLEFARKERERLGNNIKKTLTFGTSGITFIIGGLITMLIGYLI